MRTLKAGALQMVTFIIVVIALFLSSILILMHVHKQFRIQTNHTIETVKLLDEGIHYQMPKTVTTDENRTMSLIAEDDKSLKLTKGFWGVFEQMHVEAQIKNKKLVKMAFVGEQPRPSRVALFLKDNNKPLVVVGNTRIEGSAYLPKRGIKTGHISGHSYYGTKTVYGATEVSRQFPKLDSKLEAHIKLLTEYKLVNQENIQNIDLHSGKTHINSFENPLMLASSRNEIMLSNITLSGHIIVQSNRKIIVDETAKLKDVVLIAPNIEIRKDVKGIFQAFATKQLSVSENVKLNYPSALVLYGDYIKEEAHHLELASNSEIKGVLLCLGRTRSDNFDVQLKIEDNTIIEGQVYCEQNLDLRGTVYGTVYANNFLVKENGTTYQNHLYHAEINSNELTEQFVGLSFNTLPKQVMKWLY
ncbi:hypothetical protein [uncultured Psychroserpens sp.]|uniref:hypothetical protein n=1 Tax=uncultured Psychroserpens sp. TaxID=255436 RepID=UPI00262E917E|nr:hypothetical protein [uncultured Psychroserpens sp.]